MVLTKKYVAFSLGILTTLGVGMYTFNTYKTTSVANENTEGYKSGYVDGTNDILNLIGKAINKTLTVQDSEPSFDTVLANQILTEKRIYAIMNVSNPNLSKEEQRLYLKYIVKFSKKYDLPPVLVASIIHRESNFRNKLTSTVGAAGPMQVWAKWHTEKMKKHKLTKEHLYTIQYGILMGCEILREYIDAERGNFRNALYKYVGGQHHGYVKDIFAMCEYAFKIKM